METRQIRIEVEFGVSGFWDGSPGGMDELDLDLLPIDDALRRELQAWSDRYQDIYDGAYPPDSTFASAADERRFIEDGARLAEKLERALGSEWTVEYVPLRPLL